MNRGTILEWPKTNGAIFYVICTVLAVTMWGLTHYLNNVPYAAAAAGDPVALSNAQTAYGAITTLLTTLASGLLAGIGLYVTRNSKQRFEGRLFWLAALSALFACVSLYWGYISSQNVQWAIENSIPTLDMEKLQGPRQLQFATMLISVFCFAEFLRRDLTKED